MRTGRADSARHARLTLLLADGLTWAEIRAKLNCSDSYIDRWSKRFAADRLAGLFARYAGRYKVYGAMLKFNLHNLMKVDERPPNTFREAVSARRVLIFTQK